MRISSLLASTACAAVLTAGVPALSDSLQHDPHAPVPVPAAASSEPAPGPSLSDRVRLLKDGTSAAAPVLAAPGAAHASPAADAHAPAAAAPGHVVTAAAAAPPASHGSHAGWAYVGEGGPANWGTLAAEYEACGKGVEQSPINLSSPAIRGAVDIAFDYHPSVLQVLNNGHTFQVPYGAGSGIVVGGERYELLQFHFHAPSEHARDGRRYPMEVHLVHKNAAGRLAVVGVMMEAGDENISLMEMWDRMPQRAGATEVAARVAINAADLVPQGTGFYRYMGSLTTPPCSEGVNWFVADRSIQVSQGQVDKFLQAVGENARPIQALNTRLLGGPPSGE